LLLEEKIARTKLHQLLSDERSAIQLIMGMERVAMEAAERGTNQAADILTETIDGIRINDLWGEFLQTILAWNSDRDALMALLSFPVSQNTERVFYPSEDADFEEASEYGEPKGIRVGGKPFIMGYGFKWYDLAIRYTWMFLAETPAEQIRALNNSALEADNRLVFSRVFRRLFNPTNDVATIEDKEVNVYPLFNADGTVPPTYRSTTFDGSHTHYLTSGAAVITSGDLDDIATHLQHHGYTIERGYQMVLMVNEQEGNVVRGFTRAGGAKWDFIPGPRYGGGVILPAGQVITGAPDQNVGPIEDRIGTYGPFQVLEDYGIPPGYVVAFVTGGEDNIGNLVGIREHANAGLRGLRLVKGRDNDYPLIDSFYQHGLGTGVRHRGAGVVMQITAAAVYAPPPAYV
jgi:hypothetical protein